MATYTWGVPTKQTNLLPGSGNTDAVTFSQLGNVSGAPGGANTQVQFNNAGAFGGSATLTFNPVSSALTVSGNVTATAFYGDGSQLTNITVGGGSIVNGASNVSIPVVNGAIVLTVNNLPAGSIGANQTAIGVQSGAIGQGANTVAVGLQAGQAGQVPAGNGTSWRARKVTMVDVKSSGCRSVHP